jgi:nucleoside transporter
MMFLLFFIAGAFTPVLSLYLKETLHFSGVRVGMILSVTAIGSLMAPLVTAYIADRWIRAERLLALTLLISGALMLGFSAQKTFIPVIVYFFLYTLFSVPSVALTSAVIFHHFTSTRHKFGAIRVWGTIGWIAAAWIFSYFWLRQGGTGIAHGRLPDALKLAACTSFALGLYAFTLPANRPLNKKEDGKFLPMDSLRVLKTPAVLRLCFFMLAISFIDRFYYFGTAPFLRSIGFSDNHIMPVMSLGQFPEVFAMGILGWMLVRFGSRRVMLLGLAIISFRYATAAMGTPLWFVIAGLLVHGLAYTFIFTSASIYLDGFCDTASRTGAHQLFAMITSGAGNFAGSIFCGYIMDFCSSGSGAVNYRLFWSVPAIGLLLLLVFVLFFSANTQNKKGEFPPL